MLSITAHLCQSFLKPRKGRTPAESRAEGTLAINSIHGIPLVSMAHLQPNSPNQLSPGMGTHPPSQFVISAGFPTDFGPVSLRKALQKPRLSTAFTEITKNFKLECKSSGRNWHKITFHMA